MKKKFFTLLLGGVMAAGSLAAVAAPMTARAGGSGQTCDSTRSHFTSCALTPGDGQLTVRWQCNIAQTEKGPLWNRNDITFWVYEEEIPNAETKTHMELTGGENPDEGEYDWVTFGEADPPGPTGSCTVTGLTNGTTYYVYADAAVNVDAQGNEISTNGGGPEAIDHKYMYVGSCTPLAGLSNSSASSSGSSDEGEQTPYEEYLAEVEEQIAEAETGSTVVMEEGISALSKDIMKDLLDKGDVDLRMEFTYDGVDYLIIIPAGEALDEDIPWYGHLYLTARFGNRAAGSSKAGGYTVQPGDSMSRIAKKWGMTLEELAAKNPQITDMDKITVGQKINR